jgi:hypothetical protein
MNIPDISADPDKWCNVPDICWFCPDKPMNIPDISADPDK